MVLSDTVNDLILFDRSQPPSNFALFLQHYLMDLHHTWDSGSAGLPYDLIQFIGLQYDLYFMLDEFWGWSGDAMVLGKLPVPGRPTVWITVG